jgi:hypothetical protein
MTKNTAYGENPVKTLYFDKKINLHVVTGKDATKYMALDSKVAKDAHADFVD